MLARRIIPCLDVRDGKVVKGVQFKNHVVLGGIVELAQAYQQQGADELVFYDITASAEGRTIDRTWIETVAREIDIPFCVAGGIKSIESAEAILNAGADKVSVNTPALLQPDLIDQLAARFGRQCVVVGIDSRYEDNEYFVYKFTGSETTITSTKKRTFDWVKEVIDRGAGEVVLNCMNADGTKAGYDQRQLKQVRDICDVPLIASGGAGSMSDFANVFQRCDADGALAAGVFHRGEISIPKLKSYLAANHIPMRVSC